MNDDGRSDEIRRLEELVAGAAGTMAFPVLAEAHRRAGRPEEAERVARAGLEHAPQVTAGRVALALALLDQKRGDEAQRELERLLGGGSEHTIAEDVVSTVSTLPEVADESTGFSSEVSDRDERDVSRGGGELSTLDPYPNDYAPGDPYVADPSAADPRIGEPYAAAAPDEPLAADTFPSVALEPSEAGPFGPPPPPARAEPLVFDEGGVRDDELDSAFDDAESDPAQMIGADDVAQAALAAVPDEVEPDGALVAADPGSPFATETVAGLLDEQGHAEEADRIRSSLAEETAAASESTDPSGTPDPSDGDSSAAGGHAHRATLERWLDNLRRDSE